eukprot:evm.model.scf_304.4 EVM.evm.TU.scf_304.4   scf_304:32858-33036(-)
MTLVAFCFVIIRTSLVSHQHRSRAKVHCPIPWLISRTGPRILGKRTPQRSITKNANESF